MPKVDDTMPKEGKKTKIKRNRLLLVLRNLLIAVALICVAVFALEKVLEVSSVSDRAAADAAADETTRLFAMGLERSPANKIIHPLIRLSLPETMTTAGNAKDLIFPWVDDMPRQDIYDENTKRIVVLGDSFVWGHASLDRNEVFWRLLENELRAEGYNVRFDAVASPGVSAYNEIDWLTRTDLIDVLKPDMILIGYVVNDPIEPRVDRRVLDRDLADETVKYIDTNTLVPFSSTLGKVLPAIYSKLSSYLTEKQLYKTDATYYLTGELTPILTGEVREYYEENFVGPLDALAAEKQIDVAVMHLPFSPNASLAKALVKPLPEIYAACGNVRYYETIDAFQNDFADKKHAANYYVNAGDGHPGSATHFFYAQQLKQILLENYPDVLGEKQDANLRGKDILLNEWIPYRVSPQAVSLSPQSAEYTITYPSEKLSEEKQYKSHGKEIVPYFLTIPLGEHYIRVSFENPVDLKSVEIRGEDIDDIELFYAKINEELGYDDHTLSPFGKKSDGAYLWTDDTPYRVTGLCLRADIKDGAEAELTLLVHAN